MLVSLTMLSFGMHLLAQAAIFTMRYFYGRLYSYINDTVTSLSNNFSTTQLTRCRKYRRFFLSISLNLENGCILHYYQTHNLLWIYHVYTHTDVRTTTYIFYRHTLNMHTLYIKHRMNSYVFRCRHLCRHSVISTFCKVLGMSR